MKKILTLLICLSLLSICTGCTIKEPVETQDISEDYISTEYNQCLPFDLNLFYNGLENSKVISEEDCYSNVKGMISTHHLLASDLVHNLLKSVEKNHYDNIVIIGPDHSSRRGNDIIISSNDWSTPFGTLKINAKYNEKLSTHPLVKIDNGFMELEHSNSVLIPFIKYYFPAAKINTIALPTTLTIKESTDFGNFLTETLDSENTLLIASIDFSHYLLYREASLHDVETFSSISDMDFEKISRYTNDNLDSPETLITFLTYVDSIGCHKNLLENKNSAQYIKPGEEGTTSYFTMVYTSD
jgi:AmmeMemoRadiSam system protein B